MPHSTQLDKERIATSTPESEAGVLVVRNRCRRRQPHSSGKRSQSTRGVACTPCLNHYRGKKSNEIRPGVDPAALATLIIASLEGALVIAMNCTVRRRSSIINLRPSDIALAILKLAFFLDARRFSLSLWRCSDAFFTRFAC